jgi:hypothetical protein
MSDAGKFPPCVAGGAKRPCECDVEGTRLGVKDNQNLSSSWGVTDRRTTTAAACVLCAVGCVCRGGVLYSPYTQVDTGHNNLDL